MVSQLRSDTLIWFIVNVDLTSILFSFIIIFEQSYTNILLINDVPEIVHFVVSRSRDMRWYFWRYYIWFYMKVKVNQ